MNECKYEDKIFDMHEDIKDISKDVKNLLQFKWMIVGVIAFVSFVVTSFAAYLIK